MLFKLGKVEEAFVNIKKGIELEPEHSEIQEDFKMIKEAYEKGSRQN